MATDLLKNIRMRIERAGELANFSDEYILVLQGFKRRWSTDINVSIDDPTAPTGRRLTSIKVVRVWHRRPNSKWIFGGGFRMHPDVSLAQMESHAIEMSIKSWICGAPHGGSKGGAAFDPTSVSEADLISIFLKIVEEAIAAGVIGPYTDRWAPDVGTNEKIMAWIHDHFVYVMNNAKTPQSATTVTGRPLLYGGMPGRIEATARGIHDAIHIFRRELNYPLPEKPTAVLQGFGNVGMNFARLAEEFNIKIIGVLDAHGGFYHPDFPMEKLLEHVAEHPKHSVAGFEDVVKGDRINSMEELTNIKANIIVPAALEDAITHKIALNIPEGTIIAEGANGPTTPDADAILDDKNVLVIPDVYCNKGGFEVSYFEWAADTHVEPFDKQLKLPSTKDEELVFASMFNSFLRNGRAIIRLQQNLQDKKRERVSYRQASYVYAMERALPFYALKLRCPHWINRRSSLLA